MKVAAHAHVAAHKPAASSTGTVTPAQVKALGKAVNYELANNDVGIDQAQVAGSDFDKTKAPAGTPAKAAALFTKFMKAYDPRTAQQEGVRLYKLDLAMISPGHKETPVWGVQKYDESSDIMILFDKKGEVGRGKLNDDSVYNWSVRKSA